MSAGYCPACFESIPVDDTNETEGVALCRKCETLHPIGSLAALGDVPVPAGVLNDEPPAGCWMSDDEIELRVGVTTRSGVFGGFLGVFAVLWNALTCVFLVPVLGDLWRVITQPSGQSAMGDVLFKLLFMVPFVIAGIGTAIAALVGLLGHVEVHVRGSEGVVFTGVGPYGWRRRFDAAAVTSVRIVDSGARSDDQVVHAIRIDADRTIRLATMASQARRDWLAGALKSILVPGPARAAPRAILPPEERS